MSGKGSGRRPGDGYEDNHARIFGEKKRQAWVPPAQSAEVEGLRITNHGSQNVQVTFSPPPIDAVKDSAQDQGSINHLGDKLRDSTSGA